MDTASRTKTHLSNALKELSKQIPLAKISVKDLCQFSNVNRGTFYYHFKDIYDLISWTYHTQITQPARRIMEGYSITDMPSITSFILRQLYQEREFYTQALSLEGQSSIKSLIEQDSTESWKQLWEKAVGSSDFDSIEYESKEYLLEYFVRGHIAAVQHWADNGMKTDPEFLGKLLDEASLRGIVSIWTDMIERRKSVK